MKNEKEIPKPPIVHEIGGDYYYTCFWLKCGEDLKKWYNYCPKCGQRIFWEGGEYEDLQDKLVISGGTNRKTRNNKLQRASGNLV